MRRVSQPYDRFFFVFHSFKHGMRVLIDEHLNVGLASNHQARKRVAHPFTPESDSVVFVVLAVGNGRNRIGRTINLQWNHKRTINLQWNYQLYQLKNWKNSRWSYFQKNDGLFNDSMKCAALPEICKDVKLVNAATLRSSFW